MTYTQRSTLKLESIKSICALITQMQIVSIDLYQTKSQEAFVAKLPKFMDFFRDTYVEMSYIYHHDRPSQKMIDFFHALKNATEEDIDNIDPVKLMEQFSTSKTIKPIGEKK